MLCLAQSTLLKLMVGDLTPTIGDVKRHSHLAIGRYHQHSVDQLDESMVVLDFFQVLLCSCRAVAMPLRCSAACLLGKSKGCASLMRVLVMSFVGIADEASLLVRTYSELTQA